MQNQPSPHSNPTDLPKLPPTGTTITTINSNSNRHQSSNARLKVQVRREQVGKQWGYGDRERDTEREKGREGDGLGLSPSKVREFMKLFKQSNSNTRILRVSPYCNIAFKNKLMNALQQTKREREGILPYNKTNARSKTKPKTKKLKYDRWGAHTQTHQQGQTSPWLKQNPNHHHSPNPTQISQYAHAHTHTHTHSSFPVRSHPPTHTHPYPYTHPHTQGDTIPILQPQTQYLVVDLFGEQVWVEINDDVLLDGCLCGGKILAVLENRYRGHREIMKIVTIVGFNIIQLKTPNRPQKPKQPLKKPNPNPTPSTPKPLLESSSYLLSISRLNPKAPSYIDYQQIHLRPIVPRRIGEFLRVECKGKGKQGVGKDGDGDCEGEGNTQRGGNGNGNGIGCRINDVCLGDFDVVGCLGSGGFSTVFLVNCNLNNKYYAMKLVDKGFIIQTERDGIVQNQRFILETLSKRNSNKDHKDCPGGELFNQLKKVKRMTQDQARDLKPQNLLIDAQGHIKIADFGLSKPLESNKTYSYSFCGSPQYMAPEMLTKSGHNFLLDYYCLGALLYELVVGIPPFYSLNQQQIYNSILTEQLSFPANITLSPQITNLLTALLKKDPKFRLGSLCGIKQIMCHPWIGKIKRTVIEGRGLVPPFVPDLGVSNFDQEEIKVDVEGILGRIAVDGRVREFQTHFSEEFMYINPGQKFQFIDKYKQERKKLALSLSTTRKPDLKSTSLDSTDKRKFHSPHSFRTLLLKQRHPLAQTQNMQNGQKYNQKNKLSVNQQLRKPTRAESQNQCQYQSQNQCRNIKKLSNVKFGRSSERTRNKVKNNNTLINVNSSKFRGVKELEYIR